MIRRLLLLLLPLTLAAADGYAAWAQGRPGEALPHLLATAKAGDRWDAWLDAGLCAVAADERGTAVACLLAAHQRAPGQSEPLAALRALDVPLPTTWRERAGPLAWPGLGWRGVVLLVIAGLLVGSGLLMRQRRTTWLGLGGLLTFLALPGVAAPLLDSRETWLATTRDTALLDSAGTPQRALPAGTLLRQATDAAWSGRMLVALPDGRSGYVAEADVRP